ncbi:MAG: DUF4097 family beta strand repeat protein [Clostridia bacterium]|nr:DUF4097 family beta strand repeat protein [Clostridia bacterium]
MKPTSIIFLVMAVILFVGGYAMCRFASARAERDGVEIYSQRADSEGNQVYSYTVDDNSISSLKLVFSGVNVTVEPTEGESRVVLTNFPVSSYAVTMSGSTVTIDGTVGKIMSLIDRSSGGLQFRGIRYFLMKNPPDDAEKSVLVYITRYSKLNSLVITDSGGDISLSRLDNPLDYTIISSGASVSLSEVSTVSVMKIDLTSGVLNCDGCEIFTIRASISDGSARINTAGKYDASTIAYNLSAENGSIIYNGAILEEQIYKISPANTYARMEISVKNGSITLTDSVDNQVAQ